MGDHFVLLVDRLITESTLEAAIESRNRALLAASSPVDDKKIDNSFQKGDFGELSPSGEMVECRICQDEDVDSNMETPCSCSGSLKYAHRRCVQRWCNEKGDTTCEICHQQFKPGYTAPPPLFQFGQIPLNFRGNWEISRRDLNTPHIIAMVSTDRNFLNPGYEDYPVSTTRSLICCRSMALIFMVVLVFRHALPVILSGNTEYSFPLLMILLVLAASIILPLYVLVKAIAAFRSRRNQQDATNSSFASSDEETEHSPSPSRRQPQADAHVIHVG